MFFVSPDGGKIGGFLWPLLFGTESNINKS